MFRASPPRIRPRLIDGRSNSSELWSANGSDSIFAEYLDRAEDRVLAQPRRRAVRRPALDQDPHREHALRGDADVHVGRLAGDREVADEALWTSRSPPRSVSSSDSSSGTMPSRTRTSSWSRRSASASMSAGERPLHVVGAAPVEPVAVDAGLELLGPARARRRGGRAEARSAARPAGPTSAIVHRQAADLDLVGGDVARLEPALDEPGAELDALRRWRCRSRSASRSARVLPSLPITSRLCARVPATSGYGSRRSRGRPRRAPVSRSAALVRPRSPPRPRSGAARPRRAARGARRRRAASGGTASAISTRARFANTSSQPSPWA